MSTKLTIVEGNSNDKDNARAYMVKGEKGYSAYEIAVQNGYEGTEAEWKDSFLNADNYYNKTETDNKLKKKVYFFNSIASMKSSNVKNGDYVITEGYYESNDGGGANYLIRTKTENDVDDGGNIHFIGDLVAELIVKDDEINVNQFGAYGDGIHNDTIYIQKAIDFSIKQNYNPRVKLLDKVYCISNLNIKPKTKLIGSGIENTKLLIEDGSNGSALLISENAWHYCYLSDFSISCRSNNNNVTNAIEINVNNPYYDSYSTFENLRIFYIPNGNGIYNNKGGRECRFNNLIIRECGEYGLIAGSSDSLYYNISSNWNGKNGFWNRGSNNRFVNCKAYCNGTSKSTERSEIAGFYLTGGMSTFTACDSQENFGDGFFISQNLQSLINCKADANGQNSISEQGVNPTDDELLYCGFYISTKYTGSAIKNCNLIITCDDFRRATNRQLQKYGIDLEHLQFSNVIINSKNQVQDIFYGSGYSINNSNFANNFVLLNGKYFGNLLTNRLTLENLESFKQQIDFINENDIYRLYNNNGNLQIDYRNNGTYKNSPITIDGSTNNNDGNITTNTNYALNFGCRALGFFGHSTYSQQQAPSNASDLNSAISALNSLIEILKNYGLIN